MKIKAKIFTVITAITMALSISLPLYAVNTSKDNPIQPTSAEITKKSHSKKKTEAKSVFGKFLHSMLLVAGSCAAIFLILLAYKKLKRAPFVNHQNVEIDKNLNSPETVEEATRFVIEKF